MDSSWRGYGCRALNALERSVARESGRRRRIEVVVMMMVVVAKIGKLRTNGEQKKGTY